ncbi:unnamed protein product [Dovyalis caffra]|uniref:Fibronectin type III-like domain-containing protein n=1 Tax=Dovyalis caffra TaxID=77055 RepID=A0AAV1S8A7_9ROSI|nr:unnamed protein product [Dovyalis caffra]
MKEDNFIVDSRTTKTCVTDKGKGTGLGCQNRLDVYAPRPRTIHPFTQITYSYTPQSTKNSHNETPNLRFLTFVIFNSLVLRVDSTQPPFSCDSSFSGTIKSATSFPQVILTAASFDANQWYRIGQAIGKEARALYSAGKATGMTFWAPNINIFREPRWGKRARNTRRGSIDDREICNVICEKASRGSQTRINHHSKAVLKEGRTSGLMSGYNRVNGVPSSADFNLLSKSARAQWGFDGYITSDYDAVSIINDAQGYAKSREDAVFDNRKPLFLRLANGELLVAMQPGRTYRFYKGQTVFEFGYGLSYSKYSYELTAVSQNKFYLNRSSTMHEINNFGSVRFTLLSELGIEFCEQNKFPVRIGIKNHGEIAGKHPVLLFARQTKHGNGRPRKQLIGFQSVILSAGERAEIDFEVSPCEHRSRASEDDLMVMEEGTHFLVVEGQDYPISVVV